MTIGSSLAFWYVYYNHPIKNANSGIKLAHKFIGQKGLTWHNYIIFTIFISPTMSFVGNFKCIPIVHNKGGLTMPDVDLVGSFSCRKGGWDGVSLFSVCCNAKGKVFLQSDLLQNHLEVVAESSFSSRPPHMKCIHLRHLPSHLTKSNII